jgi:uncharacterized protein YlxW (UPF0749 family)
MASENIDLQFLGEQMREMQSGLRQVRADQLRLESEQVQTQERLARVDAKLEGVDRKLEAFRESVSDRFDQLVELIKSNFRALIQTIDKQDDPQR